jgi:bifunctional DNA-binding transcriptional regulator/antitoxin component of YhaV-PrlF toxin-antitoxin module
MVWTIHIRSRGVMTLPADLRDTYGIQAGDAFHVVDLDGVFVLTPRVPRVPALAREIEQARREAGVCGDALLEGLREQRERYHTETYTSNPIGNRVASGLYWNGTSIFNFAEGARYGGGIRRQRIGAVRLRRGRGGGAARRVPLWVSPAGGKVGAVARRPAPDGRTRRISPHLLP